MLLKTIFKCLFLILYSLILITVGQASQYYLSAKESRYQSLYYWQLEHPQKNTAITHFIERCMKYPPLSLENYESISLYQCGTNLGLHELVEEIKLSDKVLVQKTWPLSSLIKRMNDW